MRYWTVFGLAAAATVTWAQAPDSGRLNLFLRMKDEADRSEAMAMAAVYGLPIRELLPNGLIVELARIRHGMPLYYITDNINAAKTTRANKVHSGGGAGLSLNGSGVNIGLWDGGSARSTHVELTGRVVKPDGASGSDHATHVGGTLAASGVDAPSKGMAPAAILRSYNWTSDTTEMGTEAAAGLLLSNHSYGFVTGWSGGAPWYWFGDRPAGHTEDAGFGYYDDQAHDWDDLIYTNPYYTIFKSAGNDRMEGPSSQPVTHKEWGGSGWIDATDVRPLDGGPSGYDSISYVSTAKNVVTVGAVNDVVSYTGPASVIMSPFSCWGPTDDGRIKPDIVANGVGLKSSTNASDSAYSSYSGTSMATPNACGSAALIIQHFKSLSAGSNPRSDALRGLIIHTADECGGADGPDYAFGWGLMNTEAACALLTDNANGASPRKLARIKYASIANGETREFPVQRSSAAKLKVTLCWIDKPATPPAWAVDPPTKMLVDDLDLRIVAPDGTTTHMPWHLNPASPASAATKADNNVDNVEQVVIDAPVAGTYKIRVSHKGTLAGPVNYTLLTDNAEIVPATLTMLGVSPGTVIGGASATGTVTFSMGCFSSTLSYLSDNSLYVTVPSGVTVPAGKKTATFVVSTSVTTVQKNTTITATCNAVTKTAPLIVMPPLAIDKVTLNKSRIVGGVTPVMGTVTMNQLTPSDTTVTLSDDSASLSEPASVIVTSGTKTKTFTVSSSAVGSEILVTVSATYLAVTKTTTVTVTPPPILLSLDVSPASVVGGVSATGTVTLDRGAPTGGTIVTLWDNGAELVTPSGVTVAGSAITGTFTITTSVVASTVTRTVTASYRGVTKTDTLTITP